jgi:nitroreductase
MDVKEAIMTRRAYRSFVPVTITRELIDDMAGCAGLAPSCNNFQPWRFIFVYDPVMLGKLHAALSEGNRWAKDSSLIIAAFAEKKDDCAMPGRDYFLFDVGMAVAFIILRATELNLVAHPIAGYDEKRAKETLGIPEEMTLITLINVGKHTTELKPYFSENQIKGEQGRPPRKPQSEYAFIDRYTGR